MRVQAIMTAAVLALAVGACSRTEDAPPAAVEAPAPLPAGREGAYQAAGSDPGLNWLRGMIVQELSRT